MCRCFIIIILIYNRKYLGFNIRMYDKKFENAKTKIRTVFYRCFITKLYDSDV